MTTVIFGAGFLGTRFAQNLSGAILSRVDVTDYAAVRTELRAFQAVSVINCAGKTGRPNVDWCERHQLATQRSNTVGPLVLAEACADHGAYLLHLGSGCIFHGPSPSGDGWREDDCARPVSFYSASTYAAELTLSQLPHVGIVRLRMPVDATPGPRNLISKLASFREVIDVENSVTVVDDLVGVVRALVERRATGIYHATNPGVMRHRDLLEQYRELVDPSHRYTLIPEQELQARGLVAVARSNCRLASLRLAEHKIAMRPIDLALPDVLQKYAAARRAAAAA